MKYPNAIKISFVYAPFLQVVYPNSSIRSGHGATANIDIVAVHGLGANTAWTWTAKGVHWLSSVEMLPSILPEARIMVFGYDSQSPTAQTVAHQTSVFAKQLLDLVVELRRDCVDRPLIFIGHSFGGNIIEKAIVLAAQTSWIDNDILLNIVGIIFLGTPHGNSRGQKPSMIAVEIAGLLGHTGARLLLSLTGGYGISNDVLSQFQEAATTSSIPCFCFFELQKSDLGIIMRGRGWPFPQYKILVVDRQSASISDDPAMCKGLHKDHFKLNKFASPEDADFQEVCKVIKSFEQQASVRQGVKHLSKRRNGSPGITT